ncbi:MAG: 2-dehydropantoate 2-reductase [Burkholderiales bacterium]
MKICVVGAGAIGGMMAIKLAQSGHEVTVIIRGANLAAVRANGMKLIQDDGAETTVMLHATDKIAEAGTQDIVILAMKAHQVAPIAAELKSIVTPSTIIITTQNGIPFWYFNKLGGEYQGRHLESVDPGKVISQNIDINQILGCIIYPAAEIIAPGVIKHIEGNRFPVGEIDGSETERARIVAELFRNAGFKSPILKDIRSEIWLKLWGNCTFNPISALTHATLEAICQYPLTRELAANMMTEAKTIGEKLGVRFLISLDKRIAGAEAVGKHKTSMLQDVEAGRPLELEALVGAVIELGKITNTPTPNLSAIYACTSLLAKTLRDENGKLKI